MPVKVVKRGDLFRVVETDGSLARASRGGRPVDGGGHDTKAQAMAQARAINANTEGDK